APRRKPSRTRRHGSSAARPRRGGPAPAPLAPHDLAQHPLDHLVDRERGRIHLDRAVRLSKRCERAGRVLDVAPRDLLTHDREVCLHALGPELGLPSPGALVERRVQVELHLGVRTHDGPRVAPLEDHAAERRRPPLQRRDLLADRREPREPRGQLADPRSPDLRGHVAAVTRRQASTVTAGRPASALRVSTSPGKDVRTHSVASTTVSPSATRPATTSAMAIRWSPPDATRAPRKRWGPSITMPSGRSST